MKLQAPKAETVQDTTKLHWLLLRTSEEASDLVQDSLLFLTTKMGMTEDQAKKALGL